MPMRDKNIIEQIAQLLNVEFPPLLDPSEIKSLPGRCRSKQNSLKSSEGLKNDCRAITEHSGGTDHAGTRYYHR